MYRRVLLDLVVMSALAFVVSAYASPATAQLCREGCYRWCAENRPTERCRADCVGRPTCKTAGKIKGKACYDWCVKNKPGNPACLGDCDARGRWVATPLRTRSRPLSLPLPSSS